MTTSANAGGAMTRGLFYGWWVLLALSGLRIIASGVGHNALSLLVLPLEQEFGASRASISLMATVSSVSVALTAPLGGLLMDRYGARMIMLVTLLLSVAGYVALSMVQELWQAVALFTIPLGIAYNWAILNSGAPILNNWFDRQKARALSLLNVGHGGGALLLPLMALAITQLGWRQAMLISALGLLLAGIPAVLVSRNTPEELGLTPDGDPIRTQRSSATAAAGATLRQAIRTPFFWAMGLGTAFMLMINISLVVHMVPLLVSKGESEGVGAFLLSFQLVLSVPIVLVSGWAADRFGGSRVLAFMMLATFAGVLVMLAAQSVPGYLAANVLLAFGGSNWAILWAVIGHVFGRKNYNAIRMSIYSVLIAGMSLGPVLAGMTFDATQSYDLWLRLLLIAGVGGLVAFAVTVKSEAGARGWIQSPIAPMGRTSG